MQEIINKRLWKKKKKKNSSSKKRRERKSDLWYWMKYKRIMKISFHVEAITLLFLCQSWKWSDILTSYQTIPVGGVDVHWLGYCVWPPTAITVASVDGTKYTGDFEHSGHLPIGPQAYLTVERMYQLGNNTKQMTYILHFSVHQIPNNQWLKS